MEKPRRGCMGTRVQRVRADVGCSRNSRGGPLSCAALSSKGDANAPIPLGPHRTYGGESGRPASGRALART
jgi:hypothetical protein